MSLRALACLWIAGCYLPADDAPESVPASERAARGVVFDSANCPDRACAEARAFSVGRADARHERVVRVTDKPAEPPAPEIVVELPAITLVDCSQVQLSVVGPWRAQLRESITLEATASGIEDGVSLSWEMAGAEVTVLGPWSASLTCTEAGTHVLRVEFAPPALCPATLELEIDCEEPSPS